MLILWEHFKTKMKKIGPLERMLHCVKIDKFKKMTLYIYIYFYMIYLFLYLNCTRVIFITNVTINSYM